MTMKGERTALTVLHKAAGTSHDLEQWKKDRAALDGVAAPTPNFRAVVRLLTDHPEFLDLSEEEQLLIAAGYLDLDSQLRDTSEQLGVLEGRVRKLVEKAGEQDRADVVGVLADAQQALSTAAEAFGRVVQRRPAE